MSWYLDQSFYSDGRNLILGWLNPQRPVPLAQAFSRLKHSKLVRKRSCTRAAQLANKSGLHRMFLIQNAGYLVESAEVVVSETDY